MDKKTILGIFSLIVIIVGIIALSYFLPNQAGSLTNSTSSTNSTNSARSIYFSDDASVMYFYSDNCGWCVKQKSVLEELGKEGYKVKGMDVGKNPEYWTKYKIEGTPTFVAKNGERLVGYRDKDALKEWLDKNQ